MPKGVYDRKPRGTYSRATIVYGVGKAISGEHPRNPDYPAYVAWYNMIRRCYDKGTGFAAYQDCSVTEKWLNYQTFADWYTQQSGHEFAWEVDKDLLGTSKEYSPQNCTLLPGRINKVFISKQKTNLPTGVTWGNGAYRVKIRDINSRCQHIGMFSTVTSAIAAYQVAKQVVLTSLANSYKAFLDERAYAKLTNFYN